MLSQNPTAPAPTSSAEPSVTKAASSSVAGSNVEELVIDDGEFDDLANLKKSVQGTGMA